MLRTYRSFSISTLFVSLAVGACAEGTKLDVPMGSSSGGGRSILASGGTAAAAGLDRGTVVAAAGSRSYGSGGASASVAAVGGTSASGSGTSGSLTDGTSVGGSATIGSSGGGVSSENGGGTGHLASGGTGGQDKLAVHTAGAGATALAMSTIPAPVSGIGIKLEKQLTESNTTVRADLLLVNQGSESVDLATVKIRYYFTMDNWVTPVFERDYVAKYDASGGQLETVTNNTKAEFFNVTAPGADKYVELSFAASSAEATKTATVLKGGGNYLKIQARLHDQNYGPTNTANDYSYTGLLGYTDHITAYVNGTIVWGIEPGAVFSGAGGTSGVAGAGAAPVAIAGASSALSGTGAVFSGGGGAGSVPNGAGASATPASGSATGQAGAAGSV
jgi:hypothetical protein